MISKQETNFIKGIALVLILIGHCFPPFFPFNEFYVPIKRFLSQVGVNLFLVLSGYGVAFTYFRQQVTPWCFLQRRIITLWPLYALTMIFYSVLSIVVFDKTLSTGDFFTNLLWVQVFFNTQNEIYSASHFFSALLIAYLLVAIALFTKKIPNQLIIYLIALCIFQSICFFYYGKFLFADYLASFSLGIAILCAIERKWIGYLFVYLLLTYVYCFADGDDSLTALGGILFFAGSFKYCRSYLDKKIVKIIVYLGVQSYVIYLGHNFFLWKWPQILEKTDSVLFTGIIILGATFFWLLSLFWINKWLTQSVVKPLLDVSKVHSK